MRPLDGAAVARDQVSELVERFYLQHHESVERSRRKHRYYYSMLARVIRARIPAGSTVLDVGCGSGDLLRELDPPRGVGIDLSSPAINDARKAATGRNLHFFQGDCADRELLAGIGGPFDIIVLSNVVAQLGDVQATLEALRSVCHSRTRMIIYSYSRLWQPLLRLGEIVGFKHPSPPESWLPPEELKTMLKLADYDVLFKECQLIFPVYVPLVSAFLNRYVARLPLFSQFALMYGLLASPSPHCFTGARKSSPSVSVVIPCRNEAGNVPELIRSLPDLGPNSEFIFVEGNSVDDTEAVLRRAIDANPNRPFRFIKQSGKGKGDAMRLGMGQARGEVLVILDADLGVSPKDIPKFVNVLASGKGDFANGSRMVYPIEGRAMRFLNLLANKGFAILFTWLLGQQVRDTLCGTKALYREDYERIAANRAYFGDFDPFGDFDILFGAARLNLRIVDVAVRYHDRQYGKTNISRFTHGWMLARMSLIAARKLRFV